MVVLWGCLFLVIIIILSYGYGDIAQGNFNCGFIMYDANIVVDVIFVFLLFLIFEVELYVIIVSVNFVILIVLCVITIIELYVI